ncbi:acyl-CoA dehydrogenase family protein [Pseudomonas typographi]|uniref:acyl-CoA dehydrogenase family protein n=1 Tax=Pseudomonas typographi TaxID=2715964 RepID=UPI001682721C|nr:acyl-CoA dehydrogenase family protein [Pseudomonas typographi]MBD1550410.1 acyl-CoA dehydrogenase family protein [Pseudomonas typographi]
MLTIDLSLLTNSAESVELIEYFNPTFTRIAEGAIQREQNRELAFAEVGWLREVGFGALRVPRKYGGFGVTLPQLFELLTLLAEADSNLAQIFRPHFGFVEELLNVPNPTLCEHWFSKVVAGDLIGAAMSEPASANPSQKTAFLTSEKDHWLLNGEKFYSTGSLYSDWISVTVLSPDGGEIIAALVSATDPNVVRVDDWDGFGQRLTASGTTRFENVHIKPQQIYNRYLVTDFPPKESYLISFYQTVHLATLSGIGRAVLRDGLAFVQQRNRTYGTPGISSPRLDPLVQRVVGRLASLSFGAQSLVTIIVGTLEHTYQARIAGNADEALYSATDVQVFKAQQIIIGQVLEATTLVFEVGGSSAVSGSRQLDRHWRNARTVAAHNPAILRERALGDFYLNGVRPRESYAKKSDETTRDKQP